MSVLPVSAPGTLPGLGKELQRALVAALKEANLDAQAGKTDADGNVSARLEELGSGRCRLTLSYRSANSQSVGDLEHLDDLVYAVVAELRPKLLSELSPPATPSPPGPSRLASLQVPSPPVDSKPATILPTGASAGSKELKLTSALLTSPAKSKLPVREAALVVPDSGRRQPPAAETSLPATLPPPSTVSSSPAATSSSPTGTATSPTPSTSSPSNSETEQKPRSRPRVAVGVMGEPQGSLPPGYYGLGLAGQQALLGFLQHRLQVPAVATRLYSLVGGFEALEQSLRVSARHTLMARLDALSVHGGMLSGRVHLVLLQDGKLLYDRSVALPPTMVGSAEQPATAFARAVTAAVESLSSDLSTRL